MSVRAGWSKNKEDWKRLALSITKNKLSWNILKNFSKGALTRVPDSSGLYMLCCSPPQNNSPKLNDLFTPLYIGQSKHLKTRLKEHISKPQESIKDVYNITGNLQVLYTTCEINNLSEVEDCLIRAFGPITNVINAKNLVKILEPITTKASMGKLEKIKPLGD